MTREGEGLPHEERALVSHREARQRSAQVGPDAIIGTAGLIVIGVSLWPAAGPIRCGTRRATTLGAHLSMSLAAPSYDRSLTFASASDRTRVNASVATAVILAWSRATGRSDGRISRHAPAGGTPIVGVGAST